jgi:hypothetical protein
MRRRPPWYVRSGLPFLGVCLAVSLLSAGPSLRLDRRQTVVLRVKPMNADLAPGSEGEPLPFAVDRERGAVHEMNLLWPDPESACRLVLRASELPPPAGTAHRVELAAELALADGRQIRATRTIDLDETATSLFEVFREQGRALTLAVEAESSTETVYTSRRSVGRPVLLRLEIQRVIDGEVISLETDRLNTFVREPVSYSFRLGETGSGDSLTIKLEPLKIYGDMIKVEVEASGTLALDGDLQLVARREEWVTSRGVASTLAVESGDPPSGYRFRVTPWF